MSEPDIVRPGVKRAAGNPRDLNPLDPADPVEILDPVLAKRYERLIATFFLVAALAVVSFVAAYVVYPLGDVPLTDVQASNVWLGGSLALMLLAFGAGFVLWAKLLMPHRKLVQERHDGPSSEEDREGVVQMFAQGTADAGILRFPLLRRSLLASLAVVPLPVVVLLRDLGPLPEKKLRTTGWYKDARLVEVETQQPVKLGDLRVGGLLTVMPENKDNPEDYPLSPTLLIRLRAGEDRPLKGREGWAAADHVAYSKICSHAGCPIGLYQQETHLLFCPCHQSTFNVVEHCRVVFGPAARPLPQLAIYVDPEGYFRARGDYSVPVGPSFWERG